MPTPHLHVRPLHMWIADVIRTSGVVRPEFGTPVWRARFRLWQDTGETVDGAAEMLRRWPFPALSATPVGAELRAVVDRMARAAAVQS
jgi:hypothetical protein